MQIRNLRVVQNYSVNDDCYVLRCTDNEPLPDVKPGQFAQVKVENNASAFLRRTFSIFNYSEDDNEVDFLIKKMGHGSTALSKLQHGDMLNVILPLGKGFSLQDVTDHGRALLIGGGVGIAPMFISAKYLKKHNKKFDVLMGGKTTSDLLLLEKFQRLGNVYCTTEDGSSGTKGFVTDHACMKENLRDYDKIFCCGPEPMMKAVAKIAKNSDTYCEVSLENKMGCGFGVCLCCVTPTTTGNRCVCTEGPVFNINELKW